MLARFLAHAAGLDGLLAAPAAQAVVGGRVVQPGDPARGFHASGRGRARTALLGVAIEADLVLTAAHCLSRGGTHRRHLAGQDGRPRRHPVAGFAVHPSFVTGLTPHRQPEPIWRWCASPDR